MGSLGNNDKYYMLKSKPFLSLHTQISPRIETFFLREWIEHNLMIGVDKIYIYNHGFAIDSGADDKNRWRKKPYLNYFFEYSDQEIMDFLIEIVNDYKDVSLIDWQRKECNQYRSRCQVFGYHNCMKRHSSKYWMHIDPDEYVLSDTFLTIKDFIKDKPSKYVKFVMGQKVFGIRKFGHPTRGNVRCKNKFLRSCGKTKCIVRSGCLRPLRGRFDVISAMHSPKIKAGHEFICGWKDLRYNHYRGAVPGGFRHEMRKFKGVGQERFERMCRYNLRGKDTSMINFLKRHDIDISDYF